VSRTSTLGHKGIRHQISRLKGGQDDESEDPLDAYMRGIDEQLKKEEKQDARQTARDRLLQQHAEALEGSDSPGLEYMEYRKRRGKQVYTKLPKSDDDSIEAAYREEREMEENPNEEKEKSEEKEALANFAGDPKAMWRRKVKVRPMKALTEEQVRKNEAKGEGKRKIKRDIYDGLEGIDDGDTAKRRESLAIVVKADVKTPPPCLSWEEFRLPTKMLAKISEQGFENPTPIQSQCIPVALKGGDILGTAPTGTGKTLAFVLPMIIHVWKNRNEKELRQPKGRKPLGLVVVPTRELATQIAEECLLYSKDLNLIIRGIYGGQSKAEQNRQLRYGADIIVATPGRLMEMIEIKAAKVADVSYLVFDEADRMLDAGFEYQVRSILSRIRNDRQFLLFGATIPKRVQDLVEGTICDPVRIQVGLAGSGTHNRVNQEYILVRNAKAKNRWLIEHIEKLVDDGEVLVFCTQRERVEEVHKLIEGGGHRVCSVHSAINPNERMLFVRGFREGMYTVMVGSDLVSRGLDIRNIKSVVCLDPPRDIASHVHRIGRTARGSDKEGKAYTLVTRDDSKFAGQLVEWLEETGLPISGDLIRYALRDKSFKRNQAKLTERLEARLKQIEAEAETSGQIYEAESTAKDGVTYKRAETTRPPTASVVLSKWDLDDSTPMQSKGKRDGGNSRTSGDPKRRKYGSVVDAMMDQEQRGSSDGAADEMQVDDLA